MTSMSEPRTGTLADRLAGLGRLPVAPLLGYPGVALTGSTIRANLFDPALHRRTVRAYAERFAPDAVCYLMDLSVEAAALGLRVRYPEHESPTVEEHPVRCAADLAPFRGRRVLDDERARGFVEVMRGMKADLAGSGQLAGAYVVGPFTLAGLLMGATELAVATIDEPALVEAAVELAVEAVTPYAVALDEAGAELLIVLEPTATILSPSAFARFAAPALEALYAAVGAHPILHICGDTSRLIEAMSATGAEGLSLDGVVDLPAAAARVPADCVVIGNLDPVTVMVQQSPAGVAAAVNRLQEAMAGYPNFLLSTGCDLPPETPLANIESFMAAAR